jgi:hypothetical protein
LKAAKAALPRPNAIWLEPLDHQLVTPAPAAALRSPTMLAVVRQRCSQAQPEPQLTALVVPLLEAGGPTSELLKVKLDMTCGTPYGKAIKKASASA